MGWFLELEPGTFHKIFAGFDAVKDWVIILRESILSSMLMSFYIISECKAFVMLFEIQEPMIETKII